MRNQQHETHNANFPDRLRYRILEHRHSYPLWRAMTGIFYIDAMILKSSRAACRDQIFNRLCETGYDVGTAMIEARKQCEWEFREWKSNEDREQCDVQKDYDEQRQADWTR